MCLTPQGSPGVGRNTFLSSPHLCFIIVFICDLFDGSLRKALAVNRMNRSFPNRWSFSFLKFTKYITNIIAEHKYKYGQQEQVTVRNHNSLSVSVFAKEWYFNGYSDNCSVQENCSSVPVVLFDTPGISRCRSQYVSVESSSLLHHSIYL